MKTHRLLRSLRPWLERILLSIVVALLLITPDYLFSFAYPAYPIAFNSEGFLVYCLLAFLITGLGNGHAFRIAVAFMAMLQLGQFLHFAYFGTMIMPYEIGLLFEEWGEIWQSLAAFGWHAMYPVLAVVIPAGAIIRLRHAGRERLPRMPLALPLLIGVLSILPYRAYRGDATQAFYPSPLEFSIRNTLYAVSCRAGQALPGAHHRATSPQAFSPYRLVSLSDKAPPTIVVVMGESLTYSHMSLFGYGRTTTPWLDSMRGDPYFVARPAIASGVTTKVSLPTFFIVLREPGNTIHLVRYETNLFKMAKTRGMSTHYISAQNANLATYAGIEYADQLVTHESLGGAFEKDKDFSLLPYLEGLDLARPNFIVLHQRNSHGPYEESSVRDYDAWPLPQYADRRTYAVGTYDNSIRTTDAFLKRLWADLNRMAQGPVYLFMTSDHGEMMGEGGRFGHNALTPEVVRVPFLFAAIKGDPAVVARIRAMEHPTHYEISREIARLIGYGIDNPNERNKHYYVNGIDLDNPGSCLALVKDATLPEGWRQVQDALCTLNAPRARQG